MIFYVINGQSDEELVRLALNNYIEGTEYNYPDKIEEAFYPETKMFLHVMADTVYAVSSETYAGFYKKKTPGTRNQRFSSIIGMDIIKDIASAKVQVDIPGNGLRYYDLMLLKKIEGEWKIIGKAATAQPLPSEK